MSALLIFFGLAVAFVCLLVMSLVVVDTFLDHRPSLTIECWWRSR